MAAERIPTPRRLAAHRLNTRVDGIFGINELPVGIKLRGEGNSLALRQALFAEHAHLARLGQIMPGGPADIRQLSMLAAAVEPEHSAAAVTYMTRMPRVYGALLARDMYRKLGAKLSGSREWVSWFTENQELFAVN